MILSRARTAAGAGSRDKAVGRERAGAAKTKLPELEEFFAKRDYTGAITVLEFRRLSNKKDLKTLEWLAYAYFHYGAHDKALAVFEEILEFPDANSMNHCYCAACYFYMAKYTEAEEAVLKGPKCPLQIRILFHIAQRKSDEAKLMQYHQQLSDSMEDQLSLASIHYLRNHYQEATDIYKRLLLDNREWLALNVYVALCYYNLDYYDVSLEILAVYLQAQPDSALALNLKACNQFRLYNGKAAENELKDLNISSTGGASSPTGASASGSSSQGLSPQQPENDLVRHNLVVFRNGENAMQVLPGLLDIVPEARLNLVIYHLRNNEVKEAYELMKNLEPSSPQEYILKGVVHAAMGQQRSESQEHLKMAQQYFQLVGASASECDTIPGRQCMASCFFLLKQFDDVLIYLKSVKTYFFNDDDFNWNYGMARAATGEFKEAEDTLLQVHGEKYRREYHYLAWLCRCYIMNNKPRLAWELYLRMDNSSEDSCNLLLLIANDCYKMGHYMHAAKAFDVLERLDPTPPEYWEGKRGACIGLFHMIVQGKEPKESLRDILTQLRNTSNPQVEYIIRNMKKWGKENGIKNL